MPRHSTAGFVSILIVAAIACPLRGASVLSADAASSTEAASGFPEQAKKDDEAKPALQIKGKVTDRNGKPLANIEVAIVGPKGPLTKKTGADGAFSFEAAPGKYTFSAKG